MKATNNCLAEKYLEKTRETKTTTTKTTVTNQYLQPSSYFYYVFDDSIHDYIVFLEAVACEEGQLRNADQGSHIMNFK